MLTTMSLLYKAFIRYNANIVCCVPITCMKLYSVKLKPYMVYSVTNWLFMWIENNGHALGLENSYRIIQCDWYTQNELFLHYVLVVDFYRVSFFPKTTVTWKADLNMLLQWLFLIWINNQWHVLVQQDGVWLLTGIILCRINEILFHRWFVFVGHNSKTCLHDLINLTMYSFLLGDF